MTMRWLPFLFLGMVALHFGAAPVGAQTDGPYLRAVAQHFGVAEEEAGILSRGSLPSTEFPVLLFVADRGGASRDALLLLRRRGQSWAAIAGRYQLDAGSFHLPVGTAPPAGVLAEVYTTYAETPRGSWGGITLSDEAIVALVNLRFMSDYLGLSPDRVATELGGPGTAADAFQRLGGGS